MKTWSGWIIIALIVSGCTPVLPTLPPAPAETVIQHTPALRYIESRIQACSLSNSPLPVLVNEYPINRMNAQSADITLVYEKPIDSNLPAYLLGEDQLVVIVNPQNKISTVSLITLQGILQGFITHWEDVDPSYGQEFPKDIDIWAYESTDDLQKIIETRFNDGKSYSNHISIAENPDEISLMVSQNPGSLGVITQAALTDDVKVLEIGGVSPDNLLIPIIAQTRAQPGGNQTIMLSCLQQKSNEKKP